MTATYPKLSGPIDFVLVKQIDKSSPALFLPISMLAVLMWTLPSLLSAHSIAAWIAQLGAGTTAVVTIYRYVVRPLWKHFKKYGDLLDLAQKELKPNGGSSIFDAIRRIESKLILSDERQYSLFDKSGYAVFENDAHGNRVRSSRSYCQWVGRSSEDIVGSGWKNNIAQEDRRRVIDEWESVVRESRDFDMQYSYQSTYGHMIPCHVTAVRVVDHEDRVIGWFGVAERMDGKSAVQVAIEDSVRRHTSKCEVFQKQIEKRPI